jgi:hypothetical protein
MDGLFCMPSTCKCKGIANSFAFSLYKKCFGKTLSLITSLD